MKPINPVSTRDDNPATRFCKYCNLELVPSQKDPTIFVCPKCNVSNQVTDTYPQTKLRTTFPTYNNGSSSNGGKNHVSQSEEHSLPRSEYFIRKRLAAKNEIENQDPYLAMLKSRDDLTITNVEYYGFDDNDYLYD